MRLKKLLRKNIEPRCTYCAHGSPLADGERIACRKRGVVNTPITAVPSATIRCGAHRPSRRFCAGTSPMPIFL
ncbi:MAG: hypothetical protein ACLS69_00955 [Butyricicoccus sp.]